MYYKKIPIWENRKRLKLLKEFRNLVITYFNNIKIDLFNPIENQQAIETRRQINLLIDKVHFIVISAGILPVIYYTPPPAVGGLAGDIDLIYNIFNLHRFQIKPQYLLDFIDRAIGVYENDKLNALLRTLNPLFWISLILDYIVSLPFKFIGKIGFNQNKIESSIVGRLIKGALYLITVFAAFLTILEKLGYLKKFLSLIQGWIK